MRFQNLKDISERLTKLVDHINELVPQCTADFRSIAHKVDYLRKAGTEFQSSSRIPIQHITSQGYSFNKFVTTLHESIQTLRQISPFTGEPSEEIKNLFEPVETNSSRYGRNPRHRSWSRRSENITHGRSGGNRKRTAFQRAREQNDCVRCGKSNWTPKHRCRPWSI